MASSSISGSRAQIEAAKQQLKESQSQIESSRGQISTARQSIKQRKRVPFTSRKERIGKEQYKRTLSAAERKLIEQESELLKYKKETLDPTERKIAEVEEYNTAVDRINRAIDKGMVWAHAAYGKGLMRKLAKQYLKRRSIERRSIQKQEAKAVPEYVDPLGQGVSYDPIAAGAPIDYYKRPLPAYYDPISGKEVLQSMDPAIATRQGYVPIQLKGYQPSTRKYIIESKTGLLTPSQLEYKKLIDQVKKKSTEIPTTFEIGGAQTRQEPVDLLQSSTTPYEFATRTKPYTGKEFSRIELQRLGSKGFYEKYGYSVDNTGQRLYSGSITPVTPEDVMALAGGARAIYGVGKVAVKAAAKKIATSAGIVLSEPIARGTTKVVDLLVPRDTSGFALSGAPRQIARGALFTGTVLVPGVGTAYGTEILKGFSTDPLSTGKDLAQYAKESPYEIGTMAVFGLARGRRFKLDKKAVKIVEKNIKKLSEAKVNDITIIRRGKGSRPGTDRVMIEAVQELPEAVRKIKIEGDLLTLKEKIYFMPDAKGFATTVTVAKPSRLARSRIYQDVQIFEVGGKSSGINIGNIGDIQLFTPLGYSTYVPLKSTSTLIKKKFGPYSEARTLAEVGRRLEAADPKYGGKVVKDITLPFEDLGFKINEQVSLLTGKRGSSLILTTKEPVGQFGARGRGIKQPFESDLIQEQLATEQKVISSGKVAKDISRQSENIVSSLVPTERPQLGGVPRMVGGEGLSPQQMARYKQPSSMLVSYDVSPGLDIRDVSRAQSASNLLVPLRRTEVSQRGKTRQLIEIKAQQKFRQLEKQRQIERTKQSTKLRQLEKQRQQQVQKQIQKQAQKVGNILGIPTAPRLGFELDIVTGKPRKKIRIKKKKIPKKKKKKEKKVLPTLSQQILGIRLGRKVERPTGFEIARV